MRLCEGGEGGEVLSVQGGGGEESSWLEKAWCREEELELVEEQEEGEEQEEAPAVGKGRLSHPSLGPDTPVRLDTFSLYSLQPLFTHSRHYIHFGHSGLSPPLAHPQLPIMHPRPPPQYKAKQLQ